MCPTTCTRVTDTLLITAGQMPTAVHAPACGVDAQLWYTLAPAMELFLQDEWDGDYPYGNLYVHSVVRVAPGQYRVTATEGDTLPYEKRQATTFTLECDGMAGAVLYYGTPAGA